MEFLGERVTHPAPFFFCLLERVFRGKVIDRISYKSYTAIVEIRVPSPFHLTRVKSGRNPPSSWLDL
jgi:hypothetical protein